jgi:predicted ATP-grasp superfamily ATP-dependent carboligase
MRALVTSCRSPHALALIRGLGTRGWEVTAADNTRLSPGLYSRHTTRRLVTPNMTESPRAWLDAVLSELGTRTYDLVLPTFEEIFLVARYRRALPARIRVPVENYDKLLQVHRKPELSRLAASLDIAVPESWQPQDAEELRDIAGELRFPVVVKLPAANNSLGLSTAADPAMLHNRWRRLIDGFGTTAGGMPLIQRHVSGRQVSTLAFAQRGEVLGQMAYESVLMFPDTGGTAFVRETVRDEQVETTAAKLIGALDWTGFVGFDFIVDEASGEPTLIDGNPRPTPALALARHAGVDFAAILDEVVRGATKPLRAAAAGHRSRTLFVHVLWIAFMLVPGRGWWQRVKRVCASLRDRTAAPDVHDPTDRKPSWVLALYAPYFMLIVDAIKGRRGGYMFGCNYDGTTQEAARAPEPPAGA